MFFHIGLAGGLRRGDDEEDEIDLVARMKAFEASEPPSGRSPAPEDPTAASTSLQEARRAPTPGGGFPSSFVKKHGHEPQPADVRAALGFPRRASRSYLREIVAA